MNREKKTLPADVVECILSERNIRGTIDFVNSALSYRDQIRVKVTDLLMRQGEIHTLPNRSSSLNIVEAIDGSYATHRTIAFILLVFGAAAYSPDNPVPKQKLRYDVNAIPILFSDLVGRVAQGLMTFEEFYLAATSQADLIIMDGSFISFLTRLNSIMSAINEYPYDPAVTTIKPLIDPNDPGSFYAKAGQKFISKVLTYNLRSSGPKIIAIPKSSQSRIILRKIIHTGDQAFDEAVMKYYTDRALFTIILDKNEYYYKYFSQRDMTGRTHRANLGRRSPVRPVDADEIEDFYDDEGNYQGRGGFTLVYYRPKKWAPAYKIEIPGKVSKQVIEDILLKIRDLIVDPSIQEPYPQYMVDKIIKQIARSSKAVLDAAYANLTSYDPSLIRLLLTSYRSSISKGSR